jgi:hypothetical protein
VDRQQPDIGVNELRTPIVSKGGYERRKARRRCDCRKLVRGVALGMAAIRTDEWVTGIARGPNPVKVRVTNVAVEHEVRIMDFTKWLDRSGGSPREMTERKHIRSILGMEKSNGRQ